MIETLSGDHAVVIRLSAVGDIVLTTGVLDYWRRKHGLQFTFITREAYTPLLKNHPAITSVVSLKSKNLRGAAWLSYARQIAQSHRDSRLIDLHGSLRSRILAMVWGNDTARYPRYGMERRLYLKWRFRWARKKLRAANVPQRYALALEGTPPPREELVPNIYLSDSEKEEARALVKERGIGQPLVVVHPYATYESKTWPRDVWLQFIDQLRNAGCDWIAVGQDSNPFLASLDSKRDLTNITDLRMSCALIQYADALVSGDSGPMHLASAVDTPVVGLFGPTTEEWGFYPYGPGDNIVEAPVSCRPCSLHGRRGSKCSDECMARIDPGEVAQGLMKTLGVRRERKLLGR